jgi:hypothetical protein
MKIKSAKYHKNENNENHIIHCVIESGGEMEGADSIWVNINEDNRHYQEIQKWVAEVDENGESKGNTIEEAD